MAQNRKLNILLSAYACEPDEGSEQEVGWKWAHEISKMCDVTVITRNNSRFRIEAWQQSHPGQMRAKFIYLDVGGLAGLLKKRIPGGLYIYYFLWQLKVRKYVKSKFLFKDFDLIHHVTFASFRMPVGASGRPIVWGPVGGAEKASIELLKGYSTFTGRLRERLRNASTELASKFVRLWAPFTHCGGIALASTPATRDLLIKNGIQCEMMPTIGHDRSRSIVKPVPSLGAPLRLLYVGRLHILKGIHLILQALINKGEDTVSLTIVGSGPERKRLEAAVNDLGINRIVNFCGHVSRTQLPEFYQNHDVLVAPSLYESGGLSILEGFANGLPAIVLDCGGPSLSVSDNCGIKVPSNLTQTETVRRLSSAIDVYVQNSDILREHGLNAFKQVEDHYAWSNKRAKMLDVYNRLLGGFYE